MPATGRGGARKGAGRKSTLSNQQRLQLGAMIHARLWDKTRALFDRKLDARLSEDELPVLWEGLREHHRAGRDDDVDMTLWDIQAAIDEGVLQGRRYFQGPTKVAPGIRRQVIRGVARVVSRQWQVQVSPRLAERCLEEFRAIAARADAELADDKPDV
jgi:hypothetical protein